MFHTECGDDAVVERKNLCLYLNSWSYLQAECKNFLIIQSQLLWLVTPCSVVIGLSLWHVRSGTVQQHIYFYLNIIIIICMTYMGTSTL
jgi:hypothetical protein